MVTVPLLTVVARPADVIVTRLVFDDFQMTELVRLTLVPSVYLPVAVY